MFSAYFKSRESYIIKAYEKYIQKELFARKKREYESLKKKDYLRSAEHSRGKIIKYPSLIMLSVVVFIFLTFLKKIIRGCPLVLLRFIKFQHIFPIYRCFNSVLLNGSINKRSNLKDVDSELCAFYFNVHNLWLRA